MDKIVFVGFLALLVVIGLSKEARSENDYLIGSRKTGLWALVGTLVMTEFNSATLIGFCSVGQGAYLLPLVFLIGLLFYAAVAARKWKEYNGLSVAGFFTERYGKRIGQMASVALLLAMIGFNATYIKSLYLFLGPMLPGGEWAASGVCTLLALGMTARGGLGSVIRTDMISFVIVLLFFPMLLLFSDGGGELGVIDGRFVTSLIILTMFTYILAPWYGQKVFSARSKKIAFWGAVIAAVLVFGLYELAIFATRGMAGDGALPAALMRLPSGLRGLGYGVIFATSATTLTGAWSAMSAMVAGDFAEEKLNRKTLLTITVAFAVISYVLSNLAVDGVLDRMILANIPVAALSFALLGGFYWKKVSRAGVLASIIVGLISGIGAYLLCGPLYTWYWAIAGIPLTFLSGWAVSLLLPDRETQVA